MRTVTIRKGEPWGRSGALPSNGVIIRTDAEANQIVNHAIKNGEEIPPLGLVGGDLARALGATGSDERLRSAAAQTLPLDLGEAIFNGNTTYFVAHLVIRQLWWQGRFVAVMNSDFFGPWKLAPRAHPNDGLLDALDGSLGFNDRLKARKLALTGEHVPHPDLTIRRAKEHHITLARPTTVWIDGTKSARTKEVVIRVVPDALQCVV